MLNLNCIPKHVLEAIADDCAIGYNGPEQLQAMTVNEALDHYLHYLGIFGYAHIILQTVEALQTAARSRRIEAQPLPEKPFNIDRVLEAAVDIAFTFGTIHRKLAKEDSRENVQAIIRAAEDFERQFSAVKWGEDADYIESIDGYIATKLHDKSFPL